VVAQYEMNQSAELKSKVEEDIQLTFDNKVKVLNVVQFIDKYIKDKIAEKMVHEEV
jgi:heterodisulfide reductase subunit B